MIDFSHKVAKSLKFRDYILDLPDIGEMLEIAGRKHNHLCPRIVLGVRIGLAGGRSLGLSVPRRDKQLLTIVETDGCFISGIEAATGTAVNHRTMRVVDYGKIAATFVDISSSMAVRIAPHPDIREKAFRDSPLEERRRYFAMLIGYQTLPVEELLSFQPVRLISPVEDLISKPRIRVTCERCGEEVINQREHVHNNKVLCSSCMAPGYYTVEFNN